MRVIGTKINVPLQKALNKSDTCKRNKLLFLALALFLLLTFIVAFHYHADGNHSDCPLCIAGHHIPLVGISSTSFEIHQNIAILIGFQEFLFPPSLFLTLLTSRAPPA